MEEIQHCENSEHSTWYVLWIRKGNNVVIFREVKISSILQFCEFCAWHQGACMTWMSWSFGRMGVQAMKMHVERDCALVQWMQVQPHISMKMYVERLCASAMDECTATHLGKMFVFAKWMEESFQHLLGNEHWIMTQQKDLVKWGVCNQNDKAILDEQWLKFMIWRDSRC